MYNRISVVYEKCVAISLGTFYGTNYKTLFTAEFSAFRLFRSTSEGVLYNILTHTFSYSANCNQVLYKIKKSLFWCVQKERKQKKI